MFGRSIAQLQEEADTADSKVKTTEVVRNSLRSEDMIPVLSICKIVIREVCSREYYFIVNPVQLDVLQSPTLVDALR